MSEQTHMTEAQMAAMITPAMAAMMTPAMQETVRNMRQETVAAMQMSAARLPMDANGKSFTKDAICVVRPPATATPSVPASSAGTMVTVLSTYGERVRVRYANGDERDFHKSVLGVT